MTAITAALVKELRERSGAGMMECKKALVAAEGNIEKAMEDMRKSGQAKADKKADRTTAEGKVVIKMAEDAKSAAMVEINSETDFVARDENFNQFADQVALAALTHKVKDADALADVKVANGETVEDLRKNLVHKIGENIKVRRLARLETNGHIGAYVHGGRIGVMVELRGGDSEVAKDVAMHIAASAPIVVSQNDVPEEVQAKEKEIFIAQAKESGKPMEIIEKMITGRMRKFLDEVSLLGQPFVKDPSQKVADVLKAHHAEVVRFTRFVVGEGIEKDSTDFATEVMQQAGLKA